MSEKVSLYNPRDTPPEQLEAMLTGREHLVKEVLDSLREQAGSSTRQHWLLRGPRGIGKTHLTGIIHHRVSTDPELSKVYLSLWLGEADIYEVYSPATLLMRIAERLVEAVPGTQLAQALLTLEGTGDEDALFEELAALLTEESERQQRILLVLMENLDALFESFAPKQRTAQTRQLRALLLDNTRLLFVSTTPYRYLEALSNPKAPLFAQLKERKLNQLKVEEVGALFIKLAQITGRKDLLGSGPDAALKQRIIYQLTGGLPRSVVMAFEILRDKEGIQALVEDLRTFLDAQTAYFEARLSRLAPRERAIITTLALSDSNLTLKEIAERSRLPEKSLSTLVSRLEQEGHLEPIEGAGGKGTLYGLSEGLFRIWYQYRKGRLLLEPLVRFLAYWYEPKELEGVFESMQQRLDHDGPKAGRAARLAFMQVQAAFNLATSDHGRLERQRIWDECRKAVEQSTSQDSDRPLDPKLQSQLSDVLTLMLAGRNEEAQHALMRLLAAPVTLSQHDAVEFARFLIQFFLRHGKKKGIHHVESFRVMSKCFAESRYPSVRTLAGYSQFMLAQSLVFLKRCEEALIEADSLLALAREGVFAMDRALLLGVTSVRMGAFTELGRHEETVLVGREFLELSKDDPLRNVSIGFVGVLFLVANALGTLGRYQEQEMVYEEVLRQDSISLPAEVRGFVAKADFGLVCLKMLDGRIRPEDADEVFDTVVVRNQAILCALPAEDLMLYVEMWVEVAGDVKPLATRFLAVLFKGLLNQDIPKAVSLFLEKSSSLYRVVSAGEMTGWLNRMVGAELPAEQKQQLQMHLRLAELLHIAESKGPESVTQLRQKLSRIPKDLQELYKSLVSTLSKPA